MTNNFDNLERRMDKIENQLYIISNKIDDLNLRPVKRDSHDSKRIRKYISFDPEQYDWIEENLKTLKFSSVTHAVEWSLYVLKEKLDKEKF